MLTWDWPQPKASTLVGAISTVLLILAVACGAAATATPAPAGVPSPAAPAVSAGQTPTARPAPTAVPAVTVNPGKLTIMVGDFGNERFERAFVPGGAGGANYGRIVGGFLIATNEKTEMIPGIASKWGISADGLTWTFTIRKGVKWHDGTELTPQDVHWSLDHTFGPKAFEYVISSPVASVSRAMDRVELSGTDAVSLTSKTPLTFLAIDLSEAGSSWFHVMPKRSKLHDTEEEAAYDKSPIGAGPAKIVKRVPTDMMGFERFDDYYYQTKNGLPEDRRFKFKSLDLRLVPEEATRVAAIRAGDADIVPVSLATKKQVEAGGGRVVFGPEGVVVQVKAYGCYDPKYPCHDKRVRQALNYAINKELIRDRLYSGAEVFQVKGWAVVTPSTIGYTPAVDPFPYDPAKARQLLADAGYPGGKGFGKLVVNTWASTSMPFMVEGAQLAAEFWKRELELDVAVTVGDSTAITARQKSGDLNGQLLWRDNESRSEAAGTLSSSYGDIKSPTRMHEDPELFRLVQQTLQTVDPVQRAEAQKKLYVRLAEESYDLGIGYGNIPWGVGPRVATWQPFPLALYPSALHTISLK